VDRFISAGRWFLIGAPAVAGVLLLIFGTEGSISVAFGVTLIGIAPLIWLSNWFIRMTFADDNREQETQAREQRATDQLAAARRAQLERSRRTPAHRPGAPKPRFRGTPRSRRRP
jgi:hypothetical protein